MSIKILQPTKILGRTKISAPAEYPSSLLVYLDAGNSSSYSGSGPSWYDLTANNNDATLFNTPTYSSSFGGYFNFVDSNFEYGTIQDIGSLSKWTVEVWVRFTSSISSKVSSVVANQYDLSANLNFSLGTNNAPTNYNLAAGFFKSGWYNTNGFVPSINTWYHIVGTYDGNVIRQYVNGVANGGTNSVSTTPLSGGEIRLMRRWDDGFSIGNFMNGDLAIVKIYNTDLSSGEVLSNYSNDYNRFNPVQGVISSGLVVHLDASNTNSYTGSGTTWTNLVASGNNGVLTNGPTFSNLASGSILLDGSNDWITFTSGGLLKPSTTSYITAQAWVYPTQMKNQGVFGKLSNSFAYDGYIFGISSGGFLTANSNGTSISKQHSGSMVATVASGQWHFLSYSIIINNTSGSLRGYINTTQTLSSVHGTDGYNENNFLRVGHGYFSDTTTAFKGNIGAVYFYDRQLSPTEIQQNFDATKARYGF